MINPLDRVNILVYYGAIIDKEDYENISEKLGMNNFYASIMKHHLNFKDVGKIGESWKYVVGKEIYWDYEDHIFSFDVKDNKIIINDKEMEDINTIDIRERLLELNISSEPKLYIFNSWKEKKDESDIEGGR